MLCFGGSPGDSKNQEQSRPSSQDTSVFCDWQIRWDDSTGTSPCSGSLNPRRDEASLDTSDGNKQVTNPSDLQAIILIPLVLPGTFPARDSSDQILLPGLQSVCLHCQQRETSTREVCLSQLKPTSETGEEDNPKQYFLLPTDCTEKCRWN